MHNPQSPQSLQRDPRHTAKVERLMALRSDFIRLYTEHDAMISHTRESLYIKYLNLIGRRKYENHRIELQLRALKMKVELAQAALNHNKLPQLSEIERIVAERLEAYRLDLERRAREIETADRAVAIPDFTIEELRSIYRVLVRRLHPDLHPGQPPLHHDLFIKAVAAYRSFDLDLLRQIVKRLDLDSDSDQITLPSSDLDSAIARVERDIDDLNQKINSLRAVFPFNLEMNLLDPVWVADQQQQLDDARKSLLAQIEFYQQRLDLLIP